MWVPLEDCPVAEIDDLRAQIERLRADGLHQMESWDAEKRESSRLHASVVRYKNLVVELEGKVEDISVQRDTELERARIAEEAVEILKARVDELIGSLTRYGEHRRECRKRSLSSKLMKRDVECTCGFDPLVAGGGELDPE